MNSTKEAQGVYFSREAYAGFWRRMLVDVVDAGGRCSNLHVDMELEQVIVMEG